MFGADGLKAGGKVFAMEVKGALVVKLSAARAEAMVQGGQAQCFDPGHGRLMKQWVVVGAGSDLSWSELACEAFEFAAS